MLSGSARNAMSICSEPTGTHEKIVSTWPVRSSAGIDSRSKNTATDTANDAVTVRVASQPARGPPSRRPNTTSTRKPASGNAGMSQTTSVTVSGLELHEVVGGRGWTAAHDRHDDPEPDDDLGGGDHEHEEH